MRQLLLFFICTFFLTSCAKENVCRVKKSGALYLGNVYKEIQNNNTVVFTDTLKENAVITCDGGNITFTSPYSERTFPDDQSGSYIFDNKLNSIGTREVYTLQEERTLEYTIINTDSLGESLIYRFLGVLQ